MPIPQLQQTVPPDYLQLLDRYGPVAFLVYIVYKEIKPLIQNWLIPERKLHVQQEIDERDFERKQRQAEWERRMVREDRLQTSQDKIILNLDKQYDILQKIDNSICVSAERMLGIETEMRNTANGVTRLLDRSNHASTERPTEPLKKGRGISSTKDE